MKTVVNGIEFRSRTEAAWFLVLEAYGLDPVYEPQTYEIQGCDDNRCWYMPDFEISFPFQYYEMDFRYSFREKQNCTTKCAVEIKAGVDGEINDIAKACILGYQIPTLIIIGWPLHYRANVICDRYKGRPAGQELRFRSNLHGSKIIALGVYDELDYSFPDEDWLVLDEDDVRRVFWPKHKPAIGTVEGDVAREAWNATKWKR